MELQGQRITKQNHLFGAGIGVENLKSTEKIDSVSTDIGIVSQTGKVILLNRFITINPYIGQRFVISEVTLDVLTGIDFTFSTKVKEDATITSDIKRTYSVVKVKHPDDLRPRIQVNAYYKRVGILAGYSAGLKNLYYYNYDGNPARLSKKAYTNFLRLGISYQLE